MNTEEVRLRIAVLNQLESETWQIFKDTNKNIQREKRIIQKECPHANVVYYSDPYDSSYVCNDCGFESRTAIKTKKEEL